MAACQDIPRGATVANIPRGATVADIPQGATVAFRLSGNHSSLTGLKAYSPQLWPVRSAGGKPCWVNLTNYPREMLQESTYCCLDDLAQVLTAF